ncbi:MAG: hypothetical protein PHG95_00555 [Patescibacteria group bacterium]|nr:hypothetical protein [Patescibacteria group bacterium]
MTVLKKKKKSSSAEKDSGLKTFLERPLPGAEEVSRFEEAVKKEAAAEEAEKNLSAIYHDKQGNLVDVSRVKKRRRLRLLILFKQIFILTLLACGFYAGYYYYFQRPAGTSAIVLIVQAPEKALAGEPISYDIAYSNDSGLALSKVKLEAILPPNFVITESVPAPSGINAWNLGDIAVGGSGQVVISGYLASPVDSANVVSARLSYIPANFSSEFKKEASANTVVSGLGFIVSADYLNTAIIGQDNEMKLSLSAFKSNHLSDLYLKVSGSDNFSIAKVSLEDRESVPENQQEGSASNDNIVNLQNAGENSWLLSNLPIDSEERMTVALDFTLKAKNQDKEDLNLRLIKREADGREMTLWEKTVSFDATKSDLNLSLALNESKTDQTLGFGDTLSYQLEYANNGDSTLYDVALMAVIKGDFVDWSSLRDPLGGSVAGGAIVWTKEQIPSLSELAPGASGKIDFSLKSRNFSVADLGADTSINSYAQYGLNNNQEGSSEDNRSNAIKAQLNSDLSLSEKILYFNEDNIPVGSGPLPPRVGEKTSVRVFWTLKNNLHDLSDVQVVLNLPQGVEWSGGENTNVGSLAYDADNRQITWRLGFLPISVYRADAEFNISLIPKDGDRDKILVISPGSTVTALDSLTGGRISYKTKAKTSKLEDDEIAGLSNNGRVE